MCHNLKGQQTLCANSTIPIIGVPSKNDLLYGMQLFICIHTCIHAGPPNIHKGGRCETLFEAVFCDVGSNYCISDSVHVNNLPLVHEIFLKCLHDFTAPVTHYPLRVMWFLNGEPIDNILRERSLYGFITVLDGQILIITSAVNAVRGNYTCQLTNTAGSDVATTIISTCSSK